MCGMVNANNLSMKRYFSVCTQFLGIILWRKVYLLFCIKNKIREAINKIAQKKPK